MQRKMLTSSLAAVSVAAVAMAGASTSATAKSKNPSAGALLVNASGFTLSAFPRPGEISRVRLRIDSGLAIRLRRSAKRQTFGSYAVRVGDEPGLFGSLFVPENTRKTHIKLAAEEDQAAQVGRDGTLRATLTTGRHPSLVFTGFPRGATRLDFRTLGPGLAASQLTAKCRSKRQKVRGSLLITLRDGSHRNGNGNSSLLCGV